MAKKRLRTISFVPNIFKRVSAAIKTPFVKRRNKPKKNASWTHDLQHDSVEPSKSIIEPEEKIKVTFSFEDGKTEPSEIDVILDEEANSLSAVARSFRNASEATTANGNTVASGYVPMENFLIALTDILLIFDALGNNLIAKLVKGDLNEKEETIRSAAERENVDTLREIIDAHQRNPPKDGEANAHEALLWCMRILQFGHGIFVGVMGVELDLKEAAKESYKRVLEPHHPFFIRTVFHQALGRLPSTDEFIRNLYHGADVTEEIKAEFNWSLEAFILCAQPHINMLRDLLTSYEDLQFIDDGLHNGSNIE